MTMTIIKDDDGDDNGHDMMWGEEGKDDDGDDNNAFWSCPFPMPSLSTTCHTNPSQGQSEGNEFYWK